jgi:CheY-like chemotaxis protein
MRTSDKAAGSVDVLIAEDDTCMRAGLRALLEHQGYHCVEAVNGREALALARHSPPQCVLLDLTMPELDGFAVARQLRSDPRTRGIRIHCITGRTDEAARAQAQQAGCEMFLSKPVDVCTLLQILKSQVDPPASELASALTLSEAEDMLDWLVANGYPPGELTYQAASGFAVHCRWFVPGRPGRGSDGTLFPSP